jgi:hypothetical protein
MSSPIFNAVPGAMSGGAPGMAMGGPATSINPFEYPTTKCSCGNEIFTAGVMFKEIPGIAVGSSNEKEYVPIKVFVCSKCGKLAPQDAEFIEKESKQIKTNLI